MFFQVGGEFLETVFESDEYFWKSVHMWMYNLLEPSKGTQYICIHSITYAY